MREEISVQRLTWLIQLVSSVGDGLPRLGKFELELRSRRHRPFSSQDA